MNVLLAALIATLPLVESPAPKPGTQIAVIVSGDGGWARIDRQLTERLNAAGVSVVGLDSLQYFWHRRTPDELARAITSIIETYITAWKRSEFVLIGYSRGADVIPFAVNRMPPSARQHVTLLALLAPARRTSFEIHLRDYLDDSGSAEVVPELEMLRERTLCIYGSEETQSSACTAVKAPSIARLPLQGGHHFDGRYDELARAILAEIGR